MNTNACLVAGGIAFVLLAAAPVRAQSDADLIKSAESAAPAAVAATATIYGFDDAG